jgi:hypothetical protein
MLSVLAFLFILIPVYFSVLQKAQEVNKFKEVVVLDPKRSNAINIGMTKLAPPRTIKTAIMKMDSTIINREGIEVKGKI